MADAGDNQCVLIEPPNVPEFYADGAVVIEEADVVRIIHYVRRQLASDGPVQHVVIKRTVMPKSAWQFFHAASRALPAAMAINADGHAAAPPGSD